MGRYMANIGICGVIWTNTVGRNCKGHQLLCWDSNHHYRQELWKIISGLWRSWLIWQLDRYGMVQQSHLLQIWTLYMLCFQVDSFFLEWWWLLNRSRIYIYIYIFVRVMLELCGGWRVAEAFYFWIVTYELLKIKIEFCPNKFDTGQPNQWSN